MSREKDPQIVREAEKPIEAARMLIGKARWLVKIIVILLFLIWTKEFVLSAKEHVLTWTKNEVGSETSKATNLVALTKTNPSRDVNLGPGECSPTFTSEMGSASMGWKLHEGCVTGIANGKVRFPDCPGQKIDLDTLIGKEQFVKAQICASPMSPVRATVYARF